MNEMVVERRNSLEKDERYDLFSALLDGNADDVEDDEKLNDQELIGKFIF